MNVIPTAQAIVATVPDVAAIYSLPTKTSAFVTTTQSFAFVNGMPTSFGDQRNSEALAFLSIPVKVAKAIVSVPAEIIQARVNYDSQATAEVDAKTAALKAKLDALQAQRALDATVANPTPGQ